MTLESIKAAIKHFESLQRRYTTTHNGKHCELVKTALACLRECAERREGCEYCNTGKPLLQSGDDCMDNVRIMLAKNGTGAYYLIDEVGKHLQWAIKITECPMCGRKLERSDT